MEKRFIKNLIIFDGILVLGFCAYKIAKKNKIKEISNCYTNISSNTNSEDKEEPIVRTYTKLKRND